MSVSKMPVQRLPALPQYEITEQDKKRQAQIARAWQAFDDELEPSLEPMEDEDPETVSAEENVVSSSMRTIISFLFGKELSITAEEAAPPEAQKILDQVWGRKEKRMPLLHKLAQNGLLSGQAFLRIVPNQDGSIRLIAIDPMTVFVQTVPGDCETVWLYCIEYCCEESIGGKPIQRYYREEIRRVDPQNNDPDSQDVSLDKDTTWMAQNWTRVGDKGAWTLNGDPIPWPYSYCPIQSCQNRVRANSFWGDADTTKGLIRLNKIINFVLSNINKIVKIHAGPLLYSVGVGEGQTDTAPGKITNLPNPDSKIDAVQITTDLPNAHVFLDKLRGVGERLTSVPGLASGVTQNMPNQISGIALETMCMALLNLVDEKHCTYGELIIDTSKAIFELSNMSPEIDVELGWQNPLPNDKLAKLQGAVLAQQIGVSKTTLLRELGYDPEQEAELKKQEDEAAMVAFSRGQGMPPASPMQQPGQAPTDQPPQEQGAMQ